MNLNAATQRTFYAALVSLVVFFLFSSFAPVASAQHFLLDLACGIVFLVGVYCACTSLLQRSQLWPVAASLLAAAYCAMATLALVPFIQNVAYVALGSFFAGFILLLSPGARSSLRGFWKKTVAVSALLKIFVATVAALLFSYVVSVASLRAAGSLLIFLCCAIIGLAVYTLLWLFS